MNSRFSIGSFIKNFRGAHDPTSDWLAMLALSAIVLAGIAVWNAWMFDTVASGGVIGAPATGTTSVFNQDSLRAIDDLFKGRAEEEVKYETGVYRFADPSQ